jgi:2-hydroxychromene-2-carboxylate isomerase
MPTIEYFYSAHSSYAYIGSATFALIAARSGRTVVHRPVDLNAVVEAVGSVPFKDRTAGFRNYFFKRELMRWSEFREAPIFGRPQYHHHDTTLANCMIIAGAQGGLDVQALAHGMLEGHWRHDADLADRATLSDISTRAGYDSATLLGAAITPAALDEYRANTATAIERSMFGSPTYFVDGDMFYGQDHLEMVERALERPFAGSWPRS